MSIIPLSEPKRRLPLPAANQAIVQRKIVAPIDRGYGRHLAPAHTFPADELRKLRCRQTDSDRAAIKYRFVAAGLDAAAVAATGQRLR